MPGHYNPNEFSQIHKTLSKSFVMQRKTLVRVLGLEGRVKTLELEQAAEEQAKEGIDEILNDIHKAKEEEVGGTKTKTKPKAKVKPKAKAKPKVKPKAKKTRVTGKRIRKPKIDADKFKRGTSQETVEERLKRQAKNRKETAAAEEHKKTDEYKETATATDEKGEYLSPEERKKRFKAKFIPKTGFESKDIKPESDDQAEMGGDQGKKDDIISFLNTDVKDNLDDIRDDLKEVTSLLKDQNKSADEQYDDMRQSILTARKKKREDRLEEDKDKKPGGGLKDKMLDMVTKPAGNIFGKIIKFVTMTFLGSVVNRLVSILKDPAQLLDPIKQFFNTFVGMFNAVMKGLFDITITPINFVLGAINGGVKGIIDGINSVTGLLALPKIDPPQIPLIPGPPQVPMIPLSKTAQARNESSMVFSGGGLVPGADGPSGKDGTSGKDGASGKDGKDKTIVAMSGGGVVPGYNEGGVVTDPEERKQQEAYMLKFVNEERALQGLEPLTDLTYAPGVELTKMMGPGPRTKETSDTFTDLDRGIETTSTSKTVDGKTTFGASMRQTTEEDRQKFFAENPQAQELVNLKDQSELDSLGASISAKAKMSGGGIVPSPYPTTNLLGTSHNVINTAPNNIMGYNKGGKVPGSGNGDTVPAMLTPGEFVMSKGAVNMIGADKLMAMNAAGGGTNQPKLMKFAGGGIVPGIDAPMSRRRKVTMIRAGGKQSSPQMLGGGGSGDQTPRFSSTDPNNMSIPVIKSLYNMMG